MTIASKFKISPDQRSPGRGAASARYRGSARASRMALAAAIARATHKRYDSPLVFDDTLAFDMLFGHWRWIVANRFLDWLVLRKLLAVMRPVYGQVVARARFSEDTLHAAIARGVRQYVIVGAGLDTFALRQPELADRLTVFELDHPASQNLKRKLIERIGPVPRNLEFVEADFERESVGEALQKSCFDPAEPCFLSWLGTTFYLTEAATLATLRSIADCAAPGSELVFDFCVPEESLGPHDRAELAALKRLAARRGEPFVSSFLPAQLAERISGLGLELIEHASPDALERRYFANRGDGFRPSHFAWLAHVKVPLRHPDQSQPRRRFDAPQ